MASPQAEQLREILQSLPKDGAGTLAEQRAGAEVMWPAFTADLPGTTYEPVSVAGMPAEWIRPEGAVASRVLL